MHILLPWFMLSWEWEQNTGNLSVTNQILTIKEPIATGVMVLLPGLVAR